MRCFLIGRGISAKHLQEISNWSVQQDESAVTGATLREEWGIPADDFVVGYSGNLGRAHDWKTILEAACILKEEKGLRFLCSGGGYGYDRLQEAVVVSGVQSMFTFLPYQPLDKLGASLKVPDVHWLTLKEALTPFIFPSKFFGILQAGRPLVFIGSADGEIADLVQSNKIGYAIREGEANTCASAIKSMKADRAGTLESGKRARGLWEEKFQKSLEIDKWNALLDAFCLERQEACNV
jgi:glycosyltransferase involved in cell wall biosynthesis